MSKIQTTTTQDVRTIDGNSLALYLDATNSLRLKDSNGHSALLEDYLAGLGGGESIARVIQVSMVDIAPYVGALKERIALYINSLEYLKTANDGEIWVEYDPTLLLTAFACVEPFFGDPCIVPPQEVFPNTLYHNGLGIYPEVGDVVYSDIAGLTPFSDKILVHEIIGGGGSVTRPTDIAGLVIPFNCF